MNDKTAIPHKHDRDMVLTSDRGSMSRVKARQLGYHISDDAGTSEGMSLASWQRTIESLPEARERRSAAAQLIEEQPLMSIGRVRAFLRGLPVETEQTNTTEETMTTNDDPRAARLAEISDGIRAFNKDRGFAVKPKTAPSIASIEPAKLRRFAEIRLAALNAKGTNSAERTNLAYALQVHEQTGSPLTNVFAQLGVDTSKIIPNNI